MLVAALSSSAVRAALDSVFTEVASRLRVAMATSVFAVAFCASSAEAQWRLAPPELTVGDDSESYFEDVADVLIRGDRVYVADGGLRRIVVFDRASGQQIAATGRRGDGPGEFQRLRRVDDCGGDTIYASATGPARVSVYSQDLDHIRTFRVEDAGLREIECAGHGTFVGITRNRDPALSLGREIPMRVAWRATYDIILFEPDGSLRRVLGTFPGQERFRSPRPDGRGYSDFPLHWGLSAVFESSPQGFVVGTGETARLVRYDADGSVLDTLELGEVRIAVTRAHIDARVHDRVQWAERQGRPDIAGTRAYWEEYPYPTHFPAFSDVLVTPAGFVWVQRFPEPYLEHPFQWKVFAPDGTLAATIDVPRHLELTWVGETHVAGIVTDELGVQTVEVRGIVRESGARPIRRD